MKPFCILVQVKENRDNSVGFNDSLRVELRNGDIPNMKYWNSENQIRKNLVLSS